MTPLRKLTTAIMSCLLLVLTPGAALSWEADMHYGLVKWLAFKAGFALTDAEIIAAGSQSADESNVLDATKIMIRTGCRSVEASRHVQQHHFPSGGYIPSSPRQRYVIPGHHKRLSNENRWVRQEIFIPVSRIDPRTRLDRFGASLHPLADSWAHQGEPDTVLVCPDLLFWGHPAARGGISLPYGKHNHDADLTYLFPKDPTRPRDATEAAETIYKFMENFLDENKKYEHHSGENWYKLSADVAEFAKAELAYERNNTSTKQAWFERHTEVWGTYTTYPCFLETLTLEGHRQAACSPGNGTNRSNQATKLPNNPPGIDQSVPEEVSRLVDGFLTTWIIERDFDDAVEDFMDTEVIANKLAEPVLRNIERREEPFLNQQYVDEIKISLRDAREKPDDWMRTMLGMWFVMDHGTVNDLGHGMPNGENFRTLSKKVVEPQLKFDNLSDAIHVPGQQNRYLLGPIEPSELGDRYLTSFAFRHAPRDAIMLIVEEIDGDWKISGFFWMIT